ncbi:3'-5' RNA helicase YTHDC2-like isoform X2 [Diabrotica undecimpunctata]|uniref:3'-5' RNA helicase YTHDC2-like isoform X2 n=1 Tax=Diabrotica undecimpunctata TaxID=50387 RepID=UPI003B63679B
MAHKNEKFNFKATEKSRLYLEDQLSDFERSDNYPIVPYKKSGRTQLSPPGIPKYVLPSDQIEQVQRSLAAYKSKEDIMKNINEFRTIFVYGEPASGKSTQIPQFIIEEASFRRTPCKIIVIQPNKISAQITAERVAFERNEAVGLSIGYHIVLEQLYGCHTNVIYCTPSVFLRKLCGNLNDLNNVTHIIIDDIHEYDYLSDFILIAVKRYLQEWNIKLIMLSADYNICKQFVENFEKSEVCTLKHPTLPVNIMYLEDLSQTSNQQPDIIDRVNYDLIVSLLEYKEGTILVFLPTCEDIEICKDRIANSLDPSSYTLFTIHSSMDAKEFKEMYQFHNRKIILCSEINCYNHKVNCVIDTGRANKTQWITQSCAVLRSKLVSSSSGCCYRLYTRQTFKTMAIIRREQITFDCLQELCLQTKMWAPDIPRIQKFLSSLITAPSSSLIGQAIEKLQLMGALDEKENLTILGTHLRGLSMEPRIGKMIISSIVFRCADPILTIAAFLSRKYLLQWYSHEVEFIKENRKRLVEGYMSSHLFYVEIFRKWQESIANGSLLSFCREYDVNHVMMNSVLSTRKILVGEIRSLEFFPQSSNLQRFNQNSNCWPLVKAALCTGLCPNFAYPYRGAFCAGLRNNLKLLDDTCPNPLMVVYDDIIERDNVGYLRGVTVITPMTISLLSKGVLGAYITIEYGYIFKELARLINTLYQKVVTNPQWHNFSSNDDIILSCLKEVLEIEELSAELKIPVRIGQQPRYFYPQTTIRNQSQWSYDTACALPVPEAKDNKMPLCENQQGNVFTTNRLPYFHNVDRTNNISNISSLYRENDLQYSNKLDRLKKSSKVFLLIKARERYSINIGYSTSRWTFSPQTEKKIIQMNYSEPEKEIWLFFTAKDANAFQGVAKFIRFRNEQVGRPKADILWIHKNHILFTNVRHLTNSANSNQRIYEGVDGQIIEESVGNELLRIYQG